LCFKAIHRTECILSARTHSSRVFKILTQYKKFWGCSIENKLGIKYQTYKHKIKNTWTDSSTAAQYCRVEKAKGRVWVISEMGLGKSQSIIAGYLSSRI